MRPDIESQAGKLDPEHLVDNRLYVDPRAYELEVERIFKKTWLFACHVSEVSRTGDYLATQIAHEPVVVVRDTVGDVRAYLNVCRHRASRLVGEGTGHCNAFRCPYHFWVYNLNGDLTGVTHERAYDGSGFDRSDFGLIEIAADVIHGLVFVNLDPDPMPLREHLGTKLIDALAAPLANADFAVCQFDSWPMSVNWKVYAENARDGYHVPFVHPFLRAASPPSEYHLFDNGHAIQYLGVDWDGLGDYDAEISKSAPFPGVEPGEGYIVTLFPDTTIMLRWNMISINTQTLTGPTSVQFEGRVLGLADDDEETKEARRYNYRMWFGNPIELEDHPIFTEQQRGLESSLLRYSVIARGKDTPTGTRGDDNRLRQFWRAWRHLMGLDQNSLEPLPARR